MRIAVFFVGALEDGGFNANALAGAVAPAGAGADIRIVSGVPYEQPAIREALLALMPEVDGVVFVGGQGDETVPAIAAAFPQKRFAVVQGEVTGPNLVSYEIAQEESAFLAGHLAARLTRTGMVAHLSGHRVRPGLKGRAGFAAGVRHADPDVRLLTGFCGTQDDEEVAYRWAAAQIASGADILFTMLNAARDGATRACAEGGARQIGNVLDWCARRPDVFVASAIARIDLGVARAIAGMLNGMAPWGKKVRFGLADGDFISLSLGLGVSEVLREEVSKLSIESGMAKIATFYRSGLEFKEFNI